ncbi:hypothetical protein VTK56DRAFT_1042 [Thermocarpiscus australiensis]
MTLHVDGLRHAEPPAKRLRMTRGRNDKGTATEKKQQSNTHLLSPRVTNPSSTDNVASSSSSVDPKPESKPKHVQSFRDRLFPPPKKPAVLLPVSGLPAAGKRTPAKTSVAPFFQRIEAAFQDKAPVSGTNHASTSAPGPLRSPPPDPDDLIRELREHYLRTANNLHKAATTRLARAHADISRKMTKSLHTEDEAFLIQTEQHIKRLAQPLDRFKIRSQQRGADGAVRSEENSVGELISRAEAQLETFEKEVEEFWREWAVAEGEVKGLLKGIVLASAAGVEARDGEGEGGCGSGEGEEILRRSAAAIEKEIKRAEEEVVELGEEAVGIMKEVEKDFRKATLPDLHTFFQSIDEP